MFGVPGGHVQDAVATATVRGKECETAKRPNVYKFLFCYISTGIVLYLSGLFRWCVGVVPAVCVSYGSFLSKLICLLIECLDSNKSL